MGHANTKEALSSEYQKALSKFQKTEIKVLEETFRDLAARSGKKTIDKTTFLRVFNLPGMLGERLFAIFDRSKKGSIDWPEFVCGLGWFARGTMDEKIEFIFRMYDLGGDNMISKQELETMLNSVVLAASTILNTTMFSRRRHRKPDPSVKLPDDGSHRDSGEETDSEESSNAGSNDEHDSEFDAAHPFRLPCVTSSNLHLDSQKSQKDLLSGANTTAPPTSSSSSSSVQDQSTVTAQLPPTGQANGSTQFTVSLASSEAGAPTIASISSSEQNSANAARPRITVTTAASGAVGGHSESSDENPSRSQSTSPGLHEDLSPQINDRKVPGVPPAAASSAPRGYPPPPINVHNGPTTNFPRNAVNRPPIGYNTLPAGIGRGHPIASSTSFPDLRRASGAGFDDGGYLSASSVASASDRERGGVGPGPRHNHSLSTFSHGTLGRSGLPFGGSFGPHDGSSTPQRFGHNRRRPTASRGKLEERVKKMVNDAFTHSGVNADGKLSLAQFKEWAKSYPEVLQVIFAAFGGGVRGPTGSAAHPHPAHEPGEPRQRWSVMDIISPLSSKDTTPPSLMGSRAASESVHTHAHTRESMMAHGSSFASLPHMGSHHAGQPSLVLPSAGNQPHSRTNSFNGIVDVGSPPDSARAGSPNRGVGVDPPDSPREHTPFHAACSNCGFEAKISHCYKCGKSLVRRGPDAGCCKNCGLIFQDNAMSFCMQCGHDLAVMIIEPPLVKTVDYALREQKLFERFLHEGYLWKVGSRFKQLVQRWFCLQDSFLYSFTKRDDVKPSHVLLLEGSFVENVDDSEVNSKLKWGFKIIVGEDETQHRTLYANSEAERDEWVKAIQLHAGTHNIEDYYTLQQEVLGKGRYSTVHDGVNKVSGKHYAIKIINKEHMDEKEKEALRTEIAVLKLVDHPHIVQLKNVFETRKKIFLVMSMASGGDLFDRLSAKGRFSEHVSRELIFTILHVIKYLHERGIVHRDLKPENILCRSKDVDTDIVVGDFGLSKFTTPSEIMNLPCGTIAYVAPEVLNGQGYGFEVDLWSVGVMLYIFIRGQFPFYGSDKESMVKSISEGKISFSHPIWSTVSNECKDLLKNLLLVDPHCRFTVDSALAHPWFKIKLRVATPKFRSTPTDYKQGSLNPQALNLPAPNPNETAPPAGVQLEVPAPLTQTDRQISQQSDMPSPRTLTNTAHNASSGFTIAGQTAPAPLTLPADSPPAPRTPVKVSFGGEDAAQPPQM